MSQATYELVRNAQVEVNPVISEKGNVQAQVIVNDTYQHLFAQNSRVSEYLSFAANEVQLKQATQQLQDRLTHGQFFFINDHLIDHRDGKYNGYVHSDAAIDKLMDIIGFEENVRSTRRADMRLNTTVSPIILAKRWSNEDFQIDGYLQGGAFSSGISFGWSPFMSYVKGVFDIIRQICTNGMVGTTDLINTKIPLFNRWEQHLNIANQQMQNMVQSKVATRLTEMGRERTTVGDLQLIAKHALCRLDNENIAPTERQQLTNLFNITNPSFHLSDYYLPNVFNDTNVAARVPGHLSQFDGWNLVTEMYSHTTEAPESTNGGLQRLANKLLFPNIEANKGQIINMLPLISSFSDPDKAFYGLH